MTAESHLAAVLPGAMLDAFCADLADMEGNCRIVKQPAVTVITTKPHKCKACGEWIPARMACVSRSQLTKSRKWTWHFCLACNPFADARPLPERRALRWVGIMLLGAKASADVPPAVYRVLDGLRNEGLPF